MVLPSQQPPTLATGKSGKVGGALRDRPGLARALSRLGQGFEQSLASDPCAHSPLQLLIASFIPVGRRL